MTTHWPSGYGVIVHTRETQQRLQIVQQAAERGDLALTPADVPDVFSATDRLANAAMWLANSWTWAHAVDAAMTVLKELPSGLLSADRRRAIEGSGNPCLC